MSHQSPVGVLVMAYGTPGSPEQIEEYYTHIRHGRPPTREQLADLVRRYDAIGGVSPMRERTEEQVASIAEHLDGTSPGGFVVRLGQKHAAPFIEDGIESLLAEGVTLIIGLVLAPHYSSASIGQYHERANRASAELAEYRAIDDWSQEPAFIEFTATALAQRLVSMPERTTVVFTAHSLPERVLVDDPYVDRLEASASAIATTVGLHATGTDDPAGQHGRSWRIGWQSAGRTPEPWVGPDILEIISTLDSGDGNDRTDGVVVVPQGFTSDHLEVLYDLDIDARAAAESAGLTFARAETINADARVMQALAERISDAARAEHNLPDDRPQVLLPPR